MLRRRSERSSGRLDRGTCPRGRVRSSRSCQSKRRAKCCGPNLLVRRRYFLPAASHCFGDSLTCQSTCQQSRVAVGQNHLALKFDFILWIPSFDRPRPTGQMLKQRGHQRTVNVAVIAAPPSLVPLLPPPCITKRPHVGLLVGRSVAAPLPESSSGTTVDRTKEEIQRRSRPRPVPRMRAPMMTRLIFSAGSKTATRKWPTATDC